MSYTFQPCFNALEPIIQIRFFFSGLKQIVDRVVMLLKLHEVYIRMIIDSFQNFDSSSYKILIESGHKKSGTSIMISRFFKNMSRTLQLTLQNTMHNLF